jgi:glycine/D-amino acid oxidase-like deaminating enzyme
MAQTAFERSRPSVRSIEHALAGAVQRPFWLDDVSQPVRPALTSAVTADLAIVGGGYSGLWTAVLAKRRDPDARVVLLEAKTVGWAASGRNGGFVEASLTHGDDNGRSRFPSEIERLIELGLENLDDFERTVETDALDCDFERNGALSLAVEPYQVEALRTVTTDAHTVFLDTDAVRAQVDSPTYLAAVWEKRTSALVHPAKLAAELARVATENGVEIFENTVVKAIESSSGSPTAPVSVVTDRATVTAGRVALGTNVFPSLLRRNRLTTVPVYDYVLMTEPLTDEQLRSIGWSNRQGLGDGANQFHYYRLSKDNRILFGGYDAIYHYGGRVRASYENRPQTYRRLASHFFTTFPQLEGIRFTHRWAGAIDTCTRFCAFYGAARQGRVAYASGYTGLGVAATRFGANVMLDLLASETTERTSLEMVRRRPLPFPPEPLASLGIQSTRWSLDRADHNGGRRNGILKALDAAGLGFDS